MRILRSVVLASIFIFAGCSGGSSTDAGDAGADTSFDSAGDTRAEAAVDAPPPTCSTDNDCDDHRFCNGAERCMPGAVGTDMRGCVPAPSSPCFAGQMCNEAMSRCDTSCEMGGDADGDGHRATTCNGDDCDDTDANRYPGNAEVCDVNNHDEDCDTVTFGVRDADMDGYPDARCCNVRADGTMNCGVDCNDALGSVNPATSEACNTVDDNCNGTVDEGVGVPLYRDSDGDGFGDPSMTMTGCLGLLMGYVVDNTDCNDRVMSIHPGAPDVCDATRVDDDCDGTPNNPPAGCMCNVGESRPCTARGVCATGTEPCTNGTFGSCSVAGTPETCNGLDDDCDGTVDNNVQLTCYRDADDDGYAVLGTAGAAMCASVDPTRAGSVHLGCPPGYTGRAPSTATQGDCDDASAAYAVPVYCYVDSDGDGYGAASVGYECPRGTGYGMCSAGRSTRPGDCCDGDTSAHPGAAASTTRNACGNYDMNCDGAETLGSTRTFSGACSGSTASACSSSATAGWSGGIPGCGAAGVWLACLREYDPDLGGLVCHAVDQQNTQGCR